MSNYPDKAYAELEEAFEAGELTFAELNYETKLLNDDVVRDLLDKAEDLWEVTQ